MSNKFYHSVLKISEKKGVHISEAGKSKIREIERQLSNGKISEKEAIDALNYWIDSIRLSFERSDFEDLSKELRR